MMNDTVGAMRLVVLVATGALACTDPSLHIVVDQPDGITLARTVVTVYESDSLHCEDIAFSRLGPNELDAVQVAEETRMADGTTDRELEGISRTDHKVIVARGYGVDGAWLTAGCVEADLIEGVVTLTIAAMPTVIAATVLDLDMADPTRAVVATTDATGKAVSDRRVTWTVYGPAGSQPMYPATVTSPSDGIWQPSAPTCTVAGAATVHPIPPGVIGGYAVQLRAEWATQQPALYSRLGANLTAKPLAPPAGSRSYCALHTKTGLQRIACLDNGVVRDYDVTVSGATAELVQARTATYPTGTIAIISVANGLDRDVYLVSNKGAVTAVWPAESPPAGSGDACGIDVTCTVDDVVVVPTCGTVPGRIFIHTRSAGASLRLLDARGGNVTPVVTAINAAPMQLDNAGCVTRLDPNGGTPTLRQVMTFHADLMSLTGFTTATLTRAIYNCNAQGCAGNELAAGAGVAFTSGAEPRMIITSLDATGVVLLHVVMAPDTSTRDLFVERARMPSAGLPDRMVVGQFDTDSMVDLFWTIVGRRGSATSFEVAYARQVNGVPLEAISTPQAITVDAILSGDVSGEGRDDLIITGAFASQQGVVVIPLHLAAMPITIPSDTTCAP